MKDNSMLKQLNLDYLEPYNDIKLVDYRDCPSMRDPMEKYQIHDKSLHHICFAENTKIARLIVDSINFYYASL